jgi:predicted lipoprotein
MLPELEKRFQIRSRALWWLLLAAAPACAPQPMSDGERRTALKSTTELVILPTYRELTTSTTTLADALGALERAGAGESAANELARIDLSAVRQAYLDVRLPLGESRAFAFGPAVDLHSVSKLDASPLEVDKVEAALAGEGNLDVKGVRLLGADKRGLHAIEYLLFPSDDAELESALLADDEAGRRRRLYLSSVAQVVAAAAEELEQAWSPDSGDFARRFSEPGAADSVNDTVQPGLDTLLNECVFLTEIVADRKLGDPLGVNSGGDIDPTAQESELSGASLSDVLANLRGMRSIYLGSRDRDEDAASLSSLVRRKSPATDQRVRQAFDAAEASVLAIPEPLTSALEDSPSSVEDAYEAVKSLKGVLATEVLSTLGASLKFSDNDGD